jgi:hypothetical protein
MKWMAIGGLVVSAGLCVLCLACGTSREGTVGATRTQTAAPTAADLASASPSRTAAPRIDAAGAIDGLKAAGLPIGAIVVYTASSDPNSLLGRPGQYSSKVNFADSRLPPPSGSDISVTNGGSIEAFDAVSTAETRGAYLASLAQAASFLAEYDYESGTVLLRLGPKLTPDQAKVYADALSMLTGSPAALATAIPPSPTPSR